MSSFEANLGAWVIRFRLWVLAVTFLLVCVAASGVTKLTFDEDLRIYFSDENPQLVALDELEHTFTKDDNVYFVLAPAGGDVFTNDVLGAIDELTVAGWQIPYSSRVDSLANFQHAVAEDDDLIVRDLVRDAAGATAVDLARIRKIALAEPALKDQLVSTTGHSAAVNVKLLFPGESAEEKPSAAAHVDALAATFREAHPDIDLYMTGSLPMDRAFNQAGMDDGTTLVPLMYLVLLLMVGIALRSVSGTLGTVVVISTSMMTALGLAGWLGFSMNPTVINAPSIILTLAVADSVHILIARGQLMRKGMTNAEAIAESIRINFQPVVLTSVTTALGFLTLNFSEAPPFREFGNVVALGVMAALVMSLLTLPALLAVLPVRARKQKAAGFAPLAWFADTAIAHRRVVLWATSGFVLLAGLGLTRIELNDNFAEYFDERYEIEQALDYVQHNIGGTDLMSFALDSGEPGGVHDPDYLRTVDDFAGWLRAQPYVVHVAPITDTLKRLNMNMHGDDAAWYRLPEQRDLAAQYLLLYEMSLPFGLDLNDQLNVDKSTTRLNVVISGATSADIRNLDAAAYDWLEAHARPSMHQHSAGVSVMFAFMSERNTYSILSATLGALVLISIGLAFALRSVKMGLVSLVPNLVPAIATFGLWGFMVGQVGMGESIIMAFTLGIVVDNTIHFLTKYVRARRDSGAAPDEAIRYAFGTVGTALTVTTTVLMAGFGVLTLSGYQMSANMGLMTCMTVFLALVLDFLLLPTILLTVEKHNDTQDTEDDSGNPPVAVRTDALRRAS